MCCKDRVGDGWVLIVGHGYQHGVGVTVCAFHRCDMGLLVCVEARTGTNLVLCRPVQLSSVEELVVTYLSMAGSSAALL